MSTALTATSEHAPLRTVTSVHRSGQGWLRLVRVTWLLHRGGFLGLLALYSACAIVTVVESRPAHAALATYVAAGCVNRPAQLACPTLANNLTNMTDAFTALVIALSVLSVVVGVFLGAPLVSRELESGTFRFAFTQATSRSGHVLCAVTMLAAFVAAGGVVLGLLLAAWAHPFQVVGLGGESAWQSGLFNTTWFMLAAWSLVGLALGFLVGTIATRTVVAMAGTVLPVGGLVVTATSVLVPDAISIAPIAAKGLSPFGLGVGVLDRPSSSGQGPPGAWLVRSWMTGSHGDVLSGKQSQSLLDLFSSTKGQATSARQLLALHHVSYWVSYQPASHLWVLQGVMGAILLLLAILATLVVLHRLCHLT